MGRFATVLLVTLLVCFVNIGAHVSAHRQDRKGNHTKHDHDEAPQESLPRRTSIRTPIRTPSFSPIPRFSSPFKCNCLFGQYCVTCPPSFKICRASLCMQARLNEFCLNNLECGVNVCLDRKCVLRNGTAISGANTTANSTGHKHLRN